MNIYELKLLSNIEEWNIHIKRMLSAFTKISGFIPLDLNRFNNLDEDEIGYLDQLLFRFSKHQDVMGEKLFRNIMVGIGEDSKAMTFIDILISCKDFIFERVITDINTDKYITVAFPLRLPE